MREQDHGVAEQDAARFPDGERRTGLKEPYSAVSHYAGAMLSLAAWALLLQAAHGHFWGTLACSIYAGSLLFLYLASALSHTWHAPRPVQDWLSRFDYIGIFLLIAGTYAPLCLTLGRGGWGTRLLLIEYGLAALGILNVVFGRRTPHWWRVIVYVMMGWLVVLFWGPMAHALPPEAVRWLVAGGVIYSGGVLVLALDRPHLWPGRFTAHDLWHTCVLCGSACHFYLIWRWLAPLG